MLHLTVILWFLSNYLDTFLKNVTLIGFFPKSLVCISHIEKLSELTEILYSLAIHVI